MHEGERERELARRNAVRVAQLLSGVSLQHGPWCPRDRSAYVRADLDLRVRIGSLLLHAWGTDAEIRETLRPLLAAADDDQRALVGLGDIATWAPGGHEARHWWGLAACGDDDELAALAAWRAASADVRGGRTAEAVPLLEQAAAGGFVEAEEALARIAGRADGPAAETERWVHSMLTRAENRLRDDDLLDAQYVMDRLSPWPGSDGLRLWGDSIRGEIAFGRGDLDSAKVWFERLYAEVGELGARARLRLAQIAVATGDAGDARRRLAALVAEEEVVTEEAWLLLELHGDLVEEDDADDG